MKRLTAFILMLLISFSNSVFAEEIVTENVAESSTVEETVGAEDAVSTELEETADEEVKTEVRDEVKKLLSALDLMTEAEMNQSGFVTRDFAAEAIMRFTGESLDSEAQGEMYRDVDTSTTYAYSIERATELGYFHGTGNGNFEPEQEITAKEMAEVFIRFTGYSNFNDYSGAKSQILQNIGYYGKLTYGALANMMYNVLELNVIVVHRYSDNGGEFRISPDITVLNDVFDVYELKGVIVENGLTALWTDTDAAKDEIIIETAEGRETLLVGDSNIDDAIGQYVVLNFRYDRDNEEKTCVSYSVPEKKNNITEMSLFQVDYDASDDNYLFYFEEEGDDGSEKLRLSRETAIIYNGTYYAEINFDFDNLWGLEGKIIAIDNNADDIIDVLNVTAYEIYITSSVVLTSKELMAKNREDILSLDSEEYDYFSFTNHEGGKVYLEDIVTGMVLSVAKNSPSSEKQVISAILTDKTVEGTVTNFFEEEGYTYVQLDSGEEIYRLLPRVTSEPKLNKGAIFHMTKDGNVAWIDFSNIGGFQFAMVYDCIYDEFEDKLTLRIINNEEVREDIPIINKAVIDGVTVKKMSDAYQKLKAGQSVVSPGGAAFPQGVYPILLRRNNDGSLAEVDTPVKEAGESKDTLTEFASGNHMLSEQWVLGATVALRDDTQFFRIYDKKESTLTRDRFKDMKFIAFDTADALSAKGIYQYTAYRLNADSPYADFLVIYRTYGVGDDETTFMLDKITRGYDKATEQVLYKITGIDGGKPSEAFISPEFEEEFLSKKLVKGDWFRWCTDSYGHVIGWDDSKKITVKQNEENIELNNLNKGETNMDNFRTRSSSVQVMFGYVTERQGDLITLSAFAPGSTIDGTRKLEDMENSTYLIKVPSNMTITVYDAEEDIVRVGTYDEILDYKKHGKNCSLVAMRYKSGTMKEVAVLNNFSLYK